MIDELNVLVSVDPGIRGCGVAVFNDGRLYRAAYIKNPSLSKGNRAMEARNMADEVCSWVDLGHVGTLALEWPRIYASRIRAGQTKEDPNDLLALAAVGSAINTFFCTGRTYSYTPSEWKAQMEKDVCEAYVRRRLAPSELAAAEVGAKAAKSKAHNMWDAIGIGLHHLGRMKPKRVIP